MNAVNDENLTHYYQLLENCLQKNNLFPVVAGQIRLFSKGGLSSILSLTLSKVVHCFCCYIDGHSSHFEPETIKFAKDNNMIIFCLPPHTTHEAQPLDVSLFGPFKHHWKSVCHEFYQSSPGKVVLKFNFMDLFSKAWLKAVMPKNICAGFRKAGVVPFNPNAITTAASVANQSSSEEEERPSDSADKENRASDANQPHFTTEEVAKFTRRLEEGYDLHDPVYVKWLEQYHPDSLSSYTASCKDIPPPSVEGSVSTFAGSGFVEFRNG